MFETRSMFRGWSCGFWGWLTWQGRKAMILILSSSDENNILYRAQRMSKILFSPREDKIHIFKPLCNFLINIIDSIQKAVNLLLIKHSHLYNKSK